MLRSASSLFALVAFVTIFAGSSRAQENPWEGMAAPFDSAIIHYKVSGNQNGEETLYIRKGGKETAKVTRSSGKVLFITQKTNTVEIVTPDKVVHIDMDKKSGTEMVNPQKYMIEEYEKLSAEDKKTVRENAKKMGVKGASMLQQMGGQFKPEAAEFLGYKCDVVTFLGSTVYQISGTAIPLKTEMSMAGMAINTVATEVEENVDPPDEAFEPPPGVEIVFDEKADEMNREMAKSMIDWLKDPESSRRMDEMEKEMREAREREDEKESGPEQAEQEKYESEEEPERVEEKEAEEPPEQDEKMEKAREMMKKGMDALKGLFK